MMDNHAPAHPGGPSGPGAASVYARHAAQRKTPKEEADSKRTAITRVTRACNSCRRAKIRCIGADNPPCERCRSSRTECVMEKPSRPEANALEDRLQSLEAQMSSMRALLQDVVSAVCPEIRGSPSHSTSSSRAPRFWHPAQEAAHHRDPREREPTPPTRTGSPLAGEMLGMWKISNPLGLMSEMASRMERAEQKSDKKDDDGDQAGEPRKRRKLDDEDADPISRGLIHADEAAALVDIFYSGSSDFVSCYIRDRDDFLALRAKSPFSLTAVMLVGARVRDAGRPPSPAQSMLLDLVQKMAMRTLIRPGSRAGVEDVKALILLAAFNDNGWLMAGHAVRLAMDMGLNRAFNELLQSGMGSGRTSAELERERALVEKARVWFCLYRLEHQMSYGLGRPAIVREDATIHRARLLLDHPLALDSDARLIYAVELLAIRAPLHVELTATPDLPLDTATLARLRWANEQFDAWEDHWDQVLIARGENASFIRESLTMQRQLAELLLNSQLLRGVKSAADVEAMATEKRALALRAMRNALSCVDICLRGRFYTAGLVYSPHFTQVSIAFAATFLVRIARYFPDELDLRSVAEDVEAIAAILARTPAGRYARSLRLIMRKARRENILPPKPDASPGGSEPIPPAWVDAFDLDPHLLEGRGRNKDAPLPLFLNGDLGTAMGPSDSQPFVGLEDFFVPAELDDLLAHMNN